MRMVLRSLVTTRTQDVFLIFGRIEFPRVELMEFMPPESSVSLISEEMLLTIIGRLASSFARWPVDILEEQPKRTCKCSSDKHHCHRSIQWEEQRREVQQQTL